MSHPAHWPTVEYVKRRGMKTIRLRVSSERIVVSAPFFARKSEMEAFLKENSQWVEQTLARSRKKSEAVHALKDLHKNELLLRGEWKPVLRTYHARRPGIIQEKEEGVVYTYNEQWSGEPDTAHWQAFIRHLAQKEIPPRVQYWSQKLNLPFNRLFIRSQHTKWGTCSSKKNLSFNWRLMKCPDFVLDYLIVHELCHLVHLNHSTSFWRLVDTHYPEWRKAESWLKTQGKLAFLDP